MPGASTCVMYLFHFPGHPFSHLKMTVQLGAACGSGSDQLTACL